MQRVVIVGFGFMGQMHAQIYAARADAEVAGVVDKRGDEARQALEKLGIEAAVFGELGEALAAGEVDVVDVCLPTDLHPVVVLEAIGAGKHVFCEKPIALREEDGERMVSAAAEAGVQLMVGQCIRFWPEYEAVTDFVRSGEAGKLVSLNLQRFGGRPTYAVDAWVDDEERCVGAALDMHIHDTDYVLHLLGKPSGVFSRAVREETGWNYISTQYLFEGENADAVVSGEGGGLLPEKWGFRMTLKAVFEKGASDYARSQEETLRLTLGDEEPGAMDFAKPDAAAGDGGGSGGNISDLGGYYNELAYFVERLEKGEAVGVATGAQALESLRTVLAEIDSARSGKVVNVR
jgi:predicted dehydrogenase